MNLLTTGGLVSTPCHRHPIYNAMVNETFSLPGSLPMPPALGMSDAVSAQVASLKLSEPTPARHFAESRSGPVASSSGSKAMKLPGLRPRPDFRRGALAVH